jgi:type I restriction enzyme, R subunit
VRHSAPTNCSGKPLECLLFMRDVKSRNYFEQMKGRGTRTLDADSLKKVNPSAVTAKTHYVIVDAIGVTKSLKTASEPLITRPSVPLKDLATGVMMGVRDDDTVSSLAGRLARLNKQLDHKEQARILLSVGFILRSPRTTPHCAITRMSSSSSCSRRRRQPGGRRPRRRDI